MLVLKILNQMEEEKSLGEDLYSSDAHKQIVTFGSKVW